MLQHCPLSSVGIAESLVKEREIACLTDELADRRHKPQRIIAAGVLKPVDHAGRLRHRLDRRRLERLCLRHVRIKDLRAEKMKPVA